MIADLPPTEIHYTIPDDTPLSALERNERFLRSAGEECFLWSEQQWESWLKRHPHDALVAGELALVCRAKLGMRILDEVGVDWMWPYFDSTHPLHRGVESLVRYMSLLEVSVEYAQGIFYCSTAIPYSEVVDWNAVTDELIEVSRRLLMSGADLTLSHWLVQAQGKFDNRVLQAICEGVEFGPNTISFAIDTRQFEREDKVVEVTADDHPFTRSALELGYHLHELVGADSLSYTVDDWAELLVNIVNNSWHPLHQDVVDVLRYEGMVSFVVDQLLFEELYILALSDLYRPLLESWKAVRFDV